jgi:hypothetical protein
VQAKSQATARSQKPAVIATLLAVAALTATGAGLETLLAQPVEPPPGIPVAPAPDSAQLEMLGNQGIPFGPGERLEFSVDYGPIHAGTATLEVLKMLAYKGRPCYHFVSQARSAKMFDSIYKVRDRIDALVDSELFITWQYRKIQKEGEYRANHKIIYDHDALEARYDDGHVMSFPERSLDALSAFYFARLQPLAVGQTFLIPHHSDKRTYYLKVVVRDRETVKVPAGEYDCWVLEPTVGDAGPFKSKGNMLVWITTDHRRMPVLMKSKIGPGSISASLTHIIYGRPIPRTSAQAASGS